MSLNSLPDRRSHTTQMLSAHLWDLRAQTEAKLRCLTRLQKQLAAFETVESASERAEQQQHLLKDLTDIVSITWKLHEVARLSLEAAVQLGMEAAG